jgi:hypothetical protein
MCLKAGQGPVLLMIENSDAVDAAATRAWMENSRFVTRDAGDVFEALEEMQDYTTGSRPDVILLDVESCKADLPIIRGTMEAANDEEPVEILAIANYSEPSTERGAFEGNLEAVVAHLNELIPIETTSTY